MFDHGIEENLPGLTIPLLCSLDTLSEIDILSNSNGLL